MAAARDNAARIVHPEPELGDLPLSDKSRAEAESRALIDEGPSSRKPGDVSAPEAPASDASAGAPKDKPNSPMRRRIIVGVSALVALALIYFGIHYLFIGRYMISTDDAYVRANNTTLGARVSGHIDRIAVGDNVAVKAGELVFKIDDGDYKNAVDNAKAKIATQEATIERIGRQVAAQESAVDQSRAQLLSADAAVKRTEADFSRQQELSTRGFASKATFEVSQAARDQAAASVQGAKATLDASQAQVEVIKSQQAEARGQLAELKTSLAKAERDLSFTTISSPIDGVFANRIVNVGDYIQPGQRLGNLIPLNDVYIDANYKETQLARLKPGQPVKIQVDAISGRTIRGVVESVAPASGSVFTLLPPDNATGNFTKVVQRVPVRIRVPASVARENLLRPGMSVVATVNTKGSGEAGDPVSAR